MSTILVHLFALLAGLPGLVWGCGCGCLDILSTQIPLFKKIEKRSALGGIFTIPPQLNGGLLGWIDRTQENVDPIRRGSTAKQNPTDKMLRLANGVGRSVGHTALLLWGTEYSREGVSGIWRKTDPFRQNFHHTVKSCRILSLVLRKWNRSG